jgi:hypothetical protein
MKKYFLLLMGILTICFKCEKSGKETGLIYYSYSDCKEENFSSQILNDTAEVEIIIEDLLIKVIHRNALLNCCPESIVVKFTQEDSILKLDEEDINPQCDCSCFHEIKSVIRVQEHGTYILEIYPNGRLIFRKRIIV